MPQKTKSLCPTCYQEIPAEINYTKFGVTITKDCPEHGISHGLIEKDPEFYHHWKLNNGGIYEGHLVDVTTRCNLNCCYCYYEKSDRDIPVNAILAECEKVPGPYILTGGEPTLRSDLPDIIKAVSTLGPTYFLTNGTGLLDREYLKACNEHVFKYNGFSGIGLSYHAEFDGLADVLKVMGEENIKPATLFFVIDNLDQLDYVVTLSEMLRGMFDVVRIKCASNIWNESGAPQLFTSDVAKWFMNRGPTLFPSRAKTTCLPLHHNGVTYSVITWYNVHNVDLNDIDCPPTYTAKNGVTMDFVKAMLINEGIVKNG